MNTQSRLPLSVLGALVLLALPLRAGEPAAPPGTGHVLILDNERSLEGEIERQGDQYCVRRTIGQTWVPASKVLHLCQNREAAYAYLRTRANLADPDERLRLARWCQLNGLRSQALDEVTAAVQLRPSHAESQRLLRNLQRATSTPSASVPAAALATVGPEALAPSALDLNSDSLSVFVTRVQPILMNACANCHANGKGGAFQLKRSLDGGLASRKTVQQNTAAVLAQLNPAQPQLSPLLIKALSAHGDASQPPLKSKQIPAYRTLEEWVQHTLASNPQLHEHSATVAALLASPEAKPGDVPAPRTEASVVRPVAATEPAGGLIIAQPVLREANQPTPLVTSPPQAEPVDPFDPLIFNRQTQPASPEEGGKR